MPGSEAPDASDEAPDRWADAPPHVVMPVAGTLYIVDGGTRIRAVSPDGTITTIAGKESSEYGDPTEGVPATEVFLPVYDVAAGDAGTVYLSTYGAIRAVGPDGIITTLSDTSDLSMTGASGLAWDGSDNLYFSHGHQISMLPRLDEDATPVAAEDEDVATGQAGTVWSLVVIGVLLAAGTVVGQVFLRRSRRIVTGGGG